MGLAVAVVEVLVVTREVLAEYRSTNIPSPLTLPPLFPLLGEYRDHLNSTIISSPPFKINKELQAGLKISRKNEADSLMTKTSYYSYQIQVDRDKTKIINIGVPYGKFLN